jgi:hypothetical protein
MIHLSMDRPLIIEIYESLEHFPQFGASNNGCHDSMDTVATCMIQVQQQHPGGDKSMRKSTVDSWRF